VHARKRLREPEALRELVAAAVPEHPVLKLQRAAGNRAVALLLREPQATGGAGQPGGVQNVPIGQPAPAQVNETQGATPPANVTFTGGGSAAPATPGPAPDPKAPEPPHLDPTLTVDPFNVTVSLTIADLHAWRARTRLADVDFLADPSASVSVGTDPAHAVAGQAAVNLVLVHVKGNGDSVLDLGFGPAVSTDGSTTTVSGQGTAELHITEKASITFTATITPTPNASGGLDLNSSAVVGTAWHF
jgi:hypothetical protein